MYRYWSSGIHPLAAHLEGCTKVALLDHLIYPLDNGIARGNNI